MTPKERRRRAIARRRKLTAILCFVLVIGIGVLSFTLIKSANEKGSSKENSTSAVSSVPKEPEFKETTATVLSTGDIMVHSTQLDGAYVKKTKSYDFSAFFKETSKYYKNADLSVANLEVTFGSKKSGAYSGFPMFNTPDILADNIKDSGLNLLLTSNNHCYDTGLYGLKRTAQVLKKKGIEFTGTKETADDPSYIIKTINNINIGMINYTYETSGAKSAKNKKYINGMAIKTEANDLINSFSYYRLNNFYTEAEAHINSMKQSGAEFIVFYIHWGNEYQTSPSTQQKAIAQELCNMGVDIIIGSHPHVIQPMELLTSEDSTHQTVCLYSTGNAVSNQRQEIMDSCPSGHTEDGLMIQFTVRKTKNGVVLEDLDIIPTWVNKYPGGSGYQYTIFPIENTKMINSYGFSSANLRKAKNSYKRTKALLQESLTEIQQTIGCDLTY